MCVTSIMLIDGFLRFYGILRKLADIVLYISALIVCTVVFMGKAHASNVCKAEVARIVSIQGTIEVRRAQQRQQIWQKANLDTVVCMGDMIRSRTHSRATLHLANEGFLNLNQKSSMTFLPANEEKKSFLMQLFEGVIHIITRTPKPFDVTTPFVNASIHGTEFLVEATEESDRVVVYEGTVAVANDYGSVVLNDREAATASQYQAPQKIIHIHPTDAVQWALYYPALAAYWQREDADAPGTAALVQQASDALIVGQADEAKSIIAQVLRREPSNSDAYALLAIIAVTQNDKEAARDFANQAVTFNPHSAVAYIALSYAQQAHFEIEEALTSIRKSLEIDTRNALAWARLAELQMSSNKLDQALVSARQAIQLNPNLAKTQAVLGFAHLMQFDTQTAKHTFNQSIALDSADPMPRLGLGLALVREGELKAGRIQLEIAASLDPANSLIRSYLGKAYFEEKRYPLASTQFDLAKERDPKDPTPWLYDGIQKQTQNRPIEALHDIQKSIALNDNRAVYRSQLLLDRDEAARGSSLGRIFDTLGFERRSVMQTAKSLSIDPANYSAHRFLSDTYAHIPRHEIARVSELLQAQLLQPINVNPVQPHLAVADLNIITGTTPSAVGFNEFTPLMERNKLQVVASGIVGSNSTLGNEVVATMQRDRASVSLGQFHYETNGFRENNNQNHNIYNGFFQYALTPKLNVQTEVRRRETEHGDIVLDTIPFDKSYRRNLSEDMARVGLRYRLNSNQDFLLSSTYIDRSAKDLRNPAGTEYILANKSSGFVTEAQHLYRHELLNTVTGGGIYQFDSHNINSYLSPERQKEHRNADRYNLYSYSYVNYLRNVNLTLGLSYDVFTNVVGPDSKNTDKINPKFGLQWNITDNLRLRLAWFEANKTHLVAQQTLEPTQIAGFNQFFDDPNGTRTKRSGIGVDYHILENLYGGIEISQRKIGVPILGGKLDPITKENQEIEELQKQEENLYRAYLYWLPHDYWSVKSEFQFEDFSRSKKSVGTTGLSHVQTFKIPLEIDFFHPSGVLSRLAFTIVDQNLNRRLASGFNMPPIFRQSNDTFFLLDASIGYRLHNRRGIINLEARNLLDSKFDFRNINFFQSEPTSSRFIPDRTFFLRATFNF
ncbi:TonB-dependent receptor domain-containing protein [Nitrosomonas sp. PY1]|uniref:TonB-dependent receptor domain-containing protein n=1 Tax=Nitrosomonas sp. PY1 TaxID=1803906 RepID=UPI001FC814B5|nr:TonB-dependent receptor [Nitrosomonas sp. PY1]